ncbi:MAG: dihydroorotate dehydrogenase [Candidatus Bathyarchaeota archaeon]|nr:dihydroorotate dehydrogenase [Candidatus Bathyarchaeota archaeon]MDH5494485.1 dihydroorotate dehydrogenase [Candidatus Bathyarchaeota archaeon]
MTNRLLVEIARLKLANPTMLAAGILGMSRLTLKRVAEAGAGAVVTKSLGLKPRSGYTNPTVAQVEGGLVNAMGLPNPGIEHFAQEMQHIKGIKVPMIVSIYAYSPQEFTMTAKKALKTGAEGLELNVSCPHAERTGAEIGQDPKLVEEVVREVKRSVEKPVFVKLTPNVANIAELAKAAEKAGADAITAINTVKAMVIDIETAKPILGNKMGGLSGSAIKPIAVRCVYEIYDVVKIPIIGCGGIDTWKDAVEFMQAGASAVQIGTAIATKGLSVFKQVTYGIEAFLKKKKFGSVKEIVGLSHRN